MQNKRPWFGPKRRVAALLVFLAVQAMLAAALAGCGTQPPATLRVIRSLGERDTTGIDRPLAVAATRQGALLIALRADGEAEVIELDANRSPTAFHRLAALLESSPHEFGMLPDGRLVVRTRKDKIQLFARDSSGVYAVASALPVGGPLAVASDGSVYVAADATIRRYTADGKLQASWSVPAKPVALAWNSTMKRICAFIPASAPEDLRVTERSAVYAAANYGSERLGAVERGVLVTAENGSAPMDGFVRVSAPVSGFVPVGCVASVIGTLCQYTSEGGTGSLLTVTCDYSPACTANRSPQSIAVSPDGTVSVLLREHVAAGDRLALVVIGDSGFGYIRGGTLPSAAANRRPLRATIADVESAGMACTGNDILVVDGLRLWQGALRNGPLSAVQPSQPADGTFREPLAICGGGDSDAVSVLDWLRGNVQTWTDDAHPTVTPLSLAADESALDVLGGDSGIHWLAIAGRASARVASPKQSVSYAAPATLAESLTLSAWWLEPGRDKSLPPLVVSDWGGRVFSNIDGMWTSDSGGYAYPWLYYLPETGNDIAAYLRRFGLLPKTPGVAAPNWAELIRGMTRGPDGQVYLVTGRVSTYGMRVFVFGTDGQLVVQYRLPADVGLPSDIAVDREGHIWLTDPENYRVVELAAGSEGH